MISKLRSLLTRRDKQYLLFLLLFSIVISAIETIGIGVIMPFISLASDFSLISSNGYLKKAYDMFGFGSEVNFVIAIGVLLILFFIFRSVINIFYNYMLVRFAQGRYHLIAFRLFQNYLGLPYKEFVSKNSSYLTKTIVSEASNLTNLIQNFLFLCSEIFVIIFIYAMLLYVNLKITLLLTFLLGAKVLLIKLTITKKIKKEGIKRELYNKSFYEIIGASFGNFKLIKLMTNEKDILKKFDFASYGAAQANIINGTLSIMPRLFLEAVGFSLMVFTVVYLVYKYQTDIKSAIPLLSMYVLALYRLLPSINRIVSSYNSMVFGHRSLDIVHTELQYDIERFGEKRLDFQNKIELKNIEFYFEPHRPLFHGLNIEIKKGQKVAFIGESGAGKSTLVDIIIGLYKPIDGSIEIDGVELMEENIKSWRRKVGYIPQSIYLFDGGVGENVAFGREYDEAKVKEALKKANILEFFEAKEGLSTRVGEGGIILSGGQKQRVAIARALYGDPEILVLDEATSALDNETEAKIMEEIYDSSQDKTLIVIAHRLSTIERCEVVHKIEGGKIV